MKNYYYLHFTDEDIVTEQWGHLPMVTKRVKSYSLIMHDLGKKEKEFTKRYEGVC